jgi:3-oxoacyl-[acyl-carrier-protein] synthase III
MSSSLSILGVGVVLPPARPIRELVAQAGGDVEDYRGWDHACVAGPEDHPSTMANDALGAALEEAGVAVGDLKLVVFAGMSRDYVPSWSVSTEVMRLRRVPSSCVGLDVTVGCLGAMAALKLVLGWLTLDGGGQAAIVMAERWSDTIDRSETRSRGLWGHGDGGAAMVVGAGARTGSLAEFRGAEFCTHSELNGHVLIKYGGTRYRTAPPGHDPHIRQLGPTPSREVASSYQQGYRQAFDALRERTGMVPTRLICNQITPGIMPIIAEAAGVPLEHTVITGHQTGHLGTVDIVLGLRRLLDEGPLDAPAGIGASSPYAYGAGLLVPPGRDG